MWSDFAVTQMRLTVERKLTEESVKGLSLEQYYFRAKIYYVLSIFPWLLKKIKHKKIFTTNLRKHMNVNNVN